MIVYLNLDFNCCNSLELSGFDQVTNGTYSYVSVILLVPAPVELVIKQFADQVNMRFILQLIRGISRTFQKLPQYFNDTAILISLVLPSAGILLAILALNLNDSQSAMLSLGSSLWYCQKLPDIFCKLPLYFIRFYIGITTSRSFTLYARVLFILVMQSMNGGKIVNFTSLFLSPALCIAGFSTASVIVIIPFTSTYASLKSQRLECRMVF